MEQEFNDTGNCIPSKHYMVDTSKKIQQILPLIEKGKYFSIYRLLLLKCYRKLLLN
jgi:hypothetical protein